MTRPGTATSAVLALLAFLIPVSSDNLAVQLAALVSAVLWGVVGIGLLKRRQAVRVG